VGAFSLKFSIAPSGQTTDRIKKGVKNGTDLLYHHTKCGGDCGSRAGCRRKSVMFFVRFLCTPAQRKRASMLYFANVYLFIYLFFMAALFSGPG